VVAEHGREDVEAPAGEGDDGLDVAFSFGAFPQVVGLGNGAASDAVEGGEVAGAEEAAVVAAGSA
jgi:hypothetical protein